ncbi:MAG: diaminopimelate decarboxylase [Anaerolineales bacterium]|nr:diaminopimelate decarboxylase [Anaerolineales bacterium]MCB9004356.1 diaminopimelate decarboxylase [Ardenticatenaceae bacterium]
MTAFNYQNQELYCEGVPLREIAAAVGTPFYVYSESELLQRAAAFGTAVPHAHISYALKANSNPVIIRLLGEAGLGADVTSGGELFLAQHAGIAAHKILYSGVGKTAVEITAALEAGIRALHVESEMELDVIAAIAAKRGAPAPIGVRVNPDIAVETHPYISTGLHAHKFGVTLDRALAMLRRAAADPFLHPVGLAAHIGSQITAVAPFIESAQFLVKQANLLAAEGIRLEYLDVGGGLGINYEGTDAPTQAEWATAVSAPILAAGYEVVMEPGRSIVGPAGALVTAVTYTKQQGDKTFVISDAGMSDLIRPTLYKAYHPILPVRASDAPPITVDVVGPICETGDWLAKERPLPPMQPGDYLAILQAGAYGYAMSSNYNGRLRPAEVLVNEDKHHLIRQRQRHAALLDGCL